MRSLNESVSHTPVGIAIVADPSCSDRQRLGLGLTMRPSPLTPSPHHPLTNIRVLAVDDEVDILNLTAFILEETGAIIETATNVSLALERLPRFQPHLVPSDVAMPEPAEYELRRPMRSRYPEGHIPAIALTAYANETCREESLRAGGQHHLTRPVEPEQLVGAILCAIGEGDCSAFRNII